MAEEDEIIVFDEIDADVSIHYESGLIEEPAPKRRKSEILAEIDLKNAENRQVWTGSKTFRRFYDIVLSPDRSFLHSKKFCLCKSLTGL